MWVILQSLDLWAAATLKNYQLYDHYKYMLSICLSFPGSSAGKESAYSAGDLGLIPGLGRSPGEGKGYPLQYSSLSHRILHGTENNVSEYWAQNTENTAQNPELQARILQYTGEFHGESHGLYSPVHGVTKTRTGLRDFHFHFRKGNGSPLQYSCLENPMDRGTWPATVDGVAKSQTQLRWRQRYETSKV